MEEFEEYIEGEDETPTIIWNDLSLETTGDSRFAEGPTCALTMFHWMRAKSRQQGDMLTYPQLVAMLLQRFREQAWRHHVIDEVDSVISNPNKSSFEDGTYWLLRFTRDNRIFAAKVEWTSGFGSRLREVVDLTTEYHWDGNFILPISYEPYMSVQHFTFIGTDVRGIVFPDNEIVEFFSPRGVEMIDQPRAGKYISAEDATWKQPQLGDFTGMKHP